MYTQIVQLDERLTGTDNLIQDLVPVLSPSKNALADTLVNLNPSRFLATYFCFRCLLPLLVEKARTEGRRPMSQWDVEPQRGWSRQPFYTSVSPR